MSMCLTVHTEKKLPGVEPVHEKQYEDRSRGCSAACVNHKVPPSFRRPETWHRHISKLSARAENVKSVYCTCL